MIQDRPQSLLFQQFAGELVKRGFSFRFQAWGRSMIPTIQHGEVLHVQPIGDRKLRIGDIILAQTAGVLKAHRIVQECRNGFITRGDAGCESDDEITRDHIFGLVIAKECLQSGRTIRLDGVLGRFRFFAREARRQVAAWQMR